MPYLPGTSSVSWFLDRLAVPALRVLDPETAHQLTVAALKLKPVTRPALSDVRLSVSAFKLQFPNPLGIAAGFDKNGEIVDALFSMGFGFVEIGTITPLPQVGNPRPRIFRLSQDAGIINRLGFNNHGHQAVYARLSQRRKTGILGVNIGANKDSADRGNDYVSGMQRFFDVAGYFTINISSPNTPGLRDFHGARALDDLLARLVAVREGLGSQGWRPILLKISPDLTLAQLDGVVGVARRRNIDGMIVTNTTVSRPASLHDRALAGQAGGLSGRPLFALSTHMLAASYLRVENQFPLVGVGGISDAASAFEKICAGATLLQTYSGLVFKGPGLVQQICTGLLAELTRAGYRTIEAAVGTAAKGWAEGAQHV
jgi:dihydroorotate dehydrogenase